MHNTSTQKDTFTIFILVPTCSLICSTFLRADLLCFYFGPHSVQFLHIVLINFWIKIVLVILLRRFLLNSWYVELLVRIEKSSLYHNHEIHSSINLSFNPPTDRPIINSTVYRNVGCYKDNAFFRAIPWVIYTIYPTKTAVANCAARARSYHAIGFAVQYDPFGRQCYYIKDKYVKYGKYGRSDNCGGGGVGGFVANDVYLFY